MRETRLLMGMPITIDIVEPCDAALAGQVFELLADIDRRFSPYKRQSELSRFNHAEIHPAALSREMLDVLDLAEETRRASGGAFDIRRPDGALDTSGIVKGWAILKAAQMIRDAGHEDFCVEAGGDIQTSGRNHRGERWRIGIRNPFDPGGIVKSLSLGGEGVATSGTYVRGQHIYDPRTGRQDIPDLVSLTVIGPDVLEADRFATAAFAMGRDGIGFIEQVEGLEAYAIAPDGRATMTSNFEAFVP